MSRLSHQPIHPTTAAGTAKHMTAVVFHPSSQLEKEITHG